MRLWSWEKRIDGRAGIKWGVVMAETAPSAIDVLSRAHSGEDWSAVKVTALEGPVALFGMAANRRRSCSEGDLCLCNCHGELEPAS